jgi:hypothetical protein
MKSVMRSLIVRVAINRGNMPERECIMLRKKGK